MEFPPPNDKSEFDRIWYWRKWLPGRKGTPCRILARGTMNAALVEFSDGTRVVTSRYALRRAGKS